MKGVFFISKSLEQAWGYEADGTSKLTEAEKVISVSRRPATASGMGFEIDTDFLAAGNHSLIFKVAYIDVGTETWTFDYTKADTTAGQKSVVKGNTGEVRTATFFISDFKVPASGAAFFVKNTSTDFMMVRVLKNLT